MLDAFVPLPLVVPRRLVLERREKRKGSRSRRERTKVSTERKTTKKNAFGKRRRDEKIHPRGETYGASASRAHRHPPRYRATTTTTDSRRRRVEGECFWCFLSDEFEWVKYKTLRETTRFWRLRRREDFRQRRFLRVRQIVRDDIQGTSAV